MPRPSYWVQEYEKCEDCGVKTIKGNHICLDCEIKRVKAS